MRKNFFRIVGTDKAYPDDHNKTNKWTRNKVDVLATKDVKTAIEDHDMSTGEFCDWCKGNGCEMCDNYYAVIYNDNWQEWEHLEEWLDEGNARAYYADDDYRPMIKIGDKI